MALTEEQRQEFRQEMELGKQCEAAVTVTEGICTAYREKIINEIETGNCKDLVAAAAMLVAINTFRNNMLAHIRQGEYAGKELMNDE